MIWSRAIFTEYEPQTIPVKMGEVIVGYATVDDDPQIIVNITNREVRTALRENIFMGFTNSLSFDPEYTDNVQNPIKENI